MSRATCLISILIVALFINNGYCIKCWDCRSSIDPKCGDPFDNTTIPITNCEEKVPALPDSGERFIMCRKIRQIVNGELHYVRDCAYSSDDNIQEEGKFCTIKTETNNIVIEHCTCNSKDGCNSSYLFSPVPIVIFSLAFLMIKCNYIF